MARLRSQFSREPFPRNLSLSLCLLIFISVGCTPSNPNGKYGVSGSVSLDGQPLKAGTISFAQEQGQGRPAATMFREGAYSIPAEKGLAPGKYVVRILSVGTSQQSGDVPAESSPDATANDGMIGNVRPAVQLVPAEYNTQSTQIVEVTAEGANEFDFFIKTN